MDKLRAFEHILNKAEQSQNYSDELAQLLGKPLIPSDKKLSIKTVFDICDQCGFNINTYDYNMERPYPGIPLKEYIDNEKIEIAQPFFDFLRNFTEQGNFVAISEEFDGTNFYVGKMTQLIYKGMPNT